MLSGVKDGALQALKVITVTRVSVARRLYEVRLMAGEKFFNVMKFPLL